MELTTTTYSIITGAALLFSTASANLNVDHSPSTIPDISERQELPVYAATAPVCKSGVTKAAKSPISLIPSAKKKCYSLAKAAAGKKLLTADKKNTCFACHSKLGISPSTRMNSNLRDQGYDLTPAKLMEAFNAHIEEMPGSAMTIKQAGQLSHYLQSLKTLP